MYLVDGRGAQGGAATGGRYGEVALDASSRATSVACNSEHKDIEMRACIVIDVPSSWKESRISKLHTQQYDKPTDD